MDSMYIVRHSLIIWLNSPLSRDHVHFYGALNLCNGREFALPRREMTSVETAAFLRDLFACYPDQPVLLLWDRANWHKGQPVADMPAAHPCIETVSFPPASPDLNPQQHVWSLARANVSHKHTLKRHFVMPLKTNRKVALSLDGQKQGQYVRNVSL